MKRGRERALEERGKRRARKASDPLAKETRERGEDMRKREGGALGCALCTRRRGAGGEGRNGVWGRHALNIERVVEEREEAGAGERERAGRG